MASLLPKVAKRSTQGNKLAVVQLPEKESLQDVNAKLRAALQSEKNSLKQLRREMSVQLKRVQEEEQRKTALIIRDLKSRYHFEKTKELEFQRENLNKKFDSEYVKLTKMKELEHKRLQNEVRKLQTELQHSTASLLSTSGLSANARDTFESERAKLNKENQELQVTKKSLETEVNTLREQEKRTCYDVKKLKEDHSVEMARMRKETEIEIRKLLDELKVKDRQLSQAQQSSVTSGAGSGEHLPRNTKCPNETMGPVGGETKKKTMSSWEDIHASCTSAEQGNMPPGLANWTPKISELSSKLKVAEEKSKTLEDEKQRLQVRLKEMERKQRPLLEKNKKFLAKNMELSTLNRSLEDKMKDMAQENEKLKSEVLRHQRSLSRRQSAETLRELTPEDLRRELKDQQRKQVESDKTIAALKLACAEKDRRIELILHRKRKQRTSKAQNKVPCHKFKKKLATEKAAGIKETYFGYEEADSNSVADDSEMSLSIGSSSDMLDDEDVFEEFTREEFEANYQRLVREHLELEKSFAVLSASQGGTGVVEPQREAKLRSQLQSDLSDAQAKIKDLEKLTKNQGQTENCKCKDTGWLEEKEKLTKTIRALKEKIVSQENEEHCHQFQLEELQEQNEVLEFRTLELEEQCEKLSEELGETVTFTGSSSLTDTGLLQMYAQEKGTIEVSLADLKENIMQLRQEHGPRLSVEEKVCLVQYIGLIQTSSSKLKEYTITVEALKARIKQLEEEKAQILSRDQGIEADLVLEYEDTRNKLLDQELKTQQLSSEIDSLTQLEAVHSYKESHFEKLETRYQEEIAELKRRLNSASEGREYENEVFLDKLTQLRNAEKKLGELSQENEGLKSQIGELQRECVELHEQLTLQQDTLSLTESDKDTVTHPGPYLQVINLEQSDQEAAQKILELLETKGRLTSRLRQLESEAVDNGEEELRFRVEQLSQTKSKLQDKVQELQDLLDEELTHSASLEKQISSLEASHQQTGEKQVITFRVQSTESSSTTSNECQKIIVRTSKSCENSSSVAMETSENNNNKLSSDKEETNLDISSQSDDKSFNEVVAKNQATELECDLDNSEDQDKSFNEAVLRNRVTELEHRLEAAGEEVRQAQSELLTLEEDSSKRIQSLEEQIQSMEENETRLSETVSELGEIEKDLRKKVEIYENNPTTASSGAVLSSHGKDIDGLVKQEEICDKNLKRADSEQNLRDTVEQMSVNETVLHKRLSELEDKLKRYEGEKAQNTGQLPSSDSVFVPMTEVASHADVDTSKSNNSKSSTNVSCQMSENKDCDDISAVSVSDNSEHLPAEGSSMNNLNMTLQKVEAAKTNLENEIEMLQQKNNVLVQQMQDMSEKGQKEQGQLHKQLEVFKTAECNLMEQVGVLEEENLTLKGQIERLSEKVSDSQGGTEELELKLSHMRKREKGLLQVIDTLKEKIDQSAANDAESQESVKQEVIQLREKVDILLDGEEKLMDKLQEKEEIEIALRASIEKYKTALDQSEKDKEEMVDVGEGLRKRLEALEEEEKRSAEEKKTSEDSHKKQIEEYEEILNVYEMEKVKRNEVEENLRKSLEEYKQSVNQHELDKVGISEKLKRLEILEEMQEGNNKLQQIANRRIAELEASEEDLTMKVRILEQALENEDKDTGSAKMYNEQERSQRILHLQREVAELESVVEDYEHQIRDGKKVQKELRMELQQAEIKEESLGVKVKQLQGRNEELLAAVQSMQEQVVELQGQNLQQKALVSSGDQSIGDIAESIGRSTVTEEGTSQDQPLRSNDLHCVVPEIITPASNQILLQSLMPVMGKDDLSTNENRGSDDHRPSSQPQTPVDAEMLSNMTQEEILTKLQQLQQMDGFHRIKIEELCDNLEQFRKAVEVIAVAMEADADSPVLKMKPKLRDGDFESRVNEMVKCEVALKLRVLELEKKEATLSKRLGDAEQALKFQQSEYNTELEDLEHRLNQARKTEARLRAKLDYGGEDGETEAVLRIQELEEQVIDCETTEHQLKRQLEDLKARESDLRCQLQDAETGAAFGARDLSFAGSVGPLTSSLRRSEDKDKYWDLVEQVRGLEASEKELKDRVEELRKEDADQLIKKIASLERSEKGLKLKLDLIEAQEASFLETVDLSMLDSPQEILKQRIRELEQMEKHLRLQVGELEKDREELHELARKDKNVIHELNVQVRELQLKETNLKAQVNRYDLEDSKMYSKLDDLTDENAELKEQVEKLQNKERSLNAQLQRAKYQETEWQMTLEHAKEDMKIAEDKLKKKQQGLEQDRKNLREKSDEHLERISELEAMESSLRQKIRNLENNDKQLKSHITELEQEGSNSGARTCQLEGLNEILSEKVHKLEEEKSSLVYEVSDLQFNKEEKEHENERLMSQLKGVKSRLEENEARKCTMQQRMDEFASKEIEMHAKLQDLQRCDKEWRDRIEFLEHNEQKLRQRIRELEASVSTAENVRNLSGDYENEINNLKNVAEFHRQESAKLESDKNMLQRKLQHYEYAKANDEMAMIPVAELTELRTQVALLEATEKELERLEDQEACLKKAVDELRQGKDACGHEFELLELKEKAELYNTTLKAHELLKEKYEETRQQLVALQSQVKTGSVERGAQTSSKAVQVRLVEQYTLKHLSSEFKNALRNLGARHPQAYEDFVRLLQPTGQNVSHARVTSDPINLTKQLAGSLQTGATRPNQVERSRPHRRRGSRGNRDVEQSQAEDMSTSERQLWKAVEGRRSQEVSDEETDHPHWTQVEKNMSDTEEMTVTMNFDPEQEGYGSEAGVLKKTRSTESVQSVGSQSSLPPPLPNMGPPSVRRSQSPGNESYYLPSADEASEIIDEDDFHPKRLAGLGVSGVRAKSVDRDSDFSELTAPLSKKKAARSLDSIPDDSGYQETDSKILKDRIVHLEAEVRKKEDEMKDLNAKLSLNEPQHSGEISQLKNKLQNKERELETQQKVNRDTRIEMGTKDREIQTLKLKLELIEKTNKKHTVGVDSSPIRVALKPVTVTTNSTLSTTPIVHTGRSDTLSTADPQIDKKDKELRAKHEELVLRQQPLEQASEDKKALEEVVEKLKTQLNGLEGIDLERKSLESKVKALEKDVKQKAQIESDLCKENVQLKHLVDSLQRDNVHYKELESQYQLVTSQYKAMEEIKTKAQSMITPLRAKVLRLAQKCKTRNQLIGRLVAELRKYEEGTAILQEVEAMRREEDEQDYSRPISPLTARNMEELEKQVRSAEFMSVTPSKKSQAFRLPVTSASSSKPFSDSETDELLDPKLTNGLRTVVNNSHSVPNKRASSGIHYTAQSILYNSRPIKAEHDVTGVNVSKTDANANSLKLLNPPQISYKPVTLLNADSKTATVNKQQNSLATGAPSMSKLTTFGTLRAVQDYNPSKFSKSKHPKLELPLKEGDLVKQLAPSANVTTSQDVSSHSATANRKAQRSHSLTLAHPAFAVRKSPIHPALTQPHPPPNPNPTSRSRPSSQPAFVHHAGSRNASPSLSMHNNAVITTAPPASCISLPTSLRNTPVQGHFASPQGRHLTSTPGHSHPASTPLTSHQQPAPVSRFRVQRIVGQDALLLGWEPPTFDELGRSNGAMVKGYKITVDQKTSQHIPSPFMSKALLERLDLTQTHTFSIVTLGEGQCSLPAHVSFTDILTPDHLRDSDARSLPDTSIDSSTAERRVFMAVYDYDAQASSPNKDSKEELSFKTGDVVVCYGKSREDGYYFGKVHGKKGLVPASFIEEVAVFGSKSKRSYSSGSHTLSPRYPPSSSSSQSVEKTQRAS